MKKKLFAAFLLVCASFLAFGALTVSASSNGNLSYAVKNGEITITGCSDKNVQSIDIPAEIYGRPVTAIGEEAFFEFGNLERVSIPDSVKSIEYRAFERCNLSRVDITSIAAWCEIDFWDNPLRYGKNLYLNGELVTNLVIPEGVSKISARAFENCTSLTSVEIPDSVEWIGSHAFFDCTELANIKLPNNLTEIGGGVFSNTAYQNDDSNWEDGLFYINDYLMDADYRLQGAVSVKPGTRIIAGDAFYGCKKITDITIPDSVSTIGGDAFENCASVTSITIPSSVSEIGNGAFYQCISLANISIPNSVTNVGVGVFYDCTGLTNVSLGKGIEAIPKDMFYNCSSLKRVFLSQKVLEIGDNAFGNCSKIETVYFAGSESQWSNIEKNSGNESLTDAPVVLYNVKRKTYRFETNCDTKLRNINDYAILERPKLQNDGKTWQGWFDNSEYLGNPIVFPYCSNNTTLYALWSDKTGHTFESAINVQENRKYEVSIEEENQSLYYVFVPKNTKVYKFYTEGNIDTCGYLYDEDGFEIADDDDSGEESNFSVSYSLTAGKTYYIKVECYSGSGLFTLAVDDPIAYRINGIELKDTAGNEISGIPKEIFLASISFTNVCATDDAVVLLAAYNAKGAFKGVMYVSAEGVQTGATVKLTVPVNNSDGDISRLKALCWSSLDSMIPIGDEAVYSNR